MPTRSKWQSLPTEAINPATLAIDKLPGSRHRRSDACRGSQDAAAVQRERDRIALGRRHAGQGAAQGRAHRLRRRRHQRPARRPRIGRDAADVRHRHSTVVQAIMAGGKGAILKAKEGAEDNYEEGARQINRLQPTRHDVVIGVSASGMTSFVRGALTQRAAGRRAHHLRHLRSAHRAADVRRPDDRARRRPGESSPARRASRPAPPPSSCSTC